MFGRTPQSSSSLPVVLALFRFRPLGGQKVAVVSLIFPPVSGNFSTFWTLPLPKLRSPMMTARSWSCRQADRISLADADPSLTSTTIGKFR